MRVGNARSGNFDIVFFAIFCVFLRFVVILAPLWEPPEPPKIEKNAKKLIQDAFGRLVGRVKAPIVDFGTIFHLQALILV